MGSLARKAIGGSIHKIREFELEKVSLAEEFDILQIVGEGWFGKILLVEHKATDTEMVLKALPKPYTALRDFYREFHYGLHLGAHRNIISTYDVAFETAGFYVFSQEYAPLGDLTSNVSETGIGELHTKRVARQLAAALEHLHSRDLVHRDVKLDNILVFKSDFSRVKLCDFGETRRSGSVVRRQNEWLPYAPPEVLTTANDDMYKAVTSHDVWQFAIVIFVCLTGCLPWQKAAHDDPRFARFVAWHLSAIPIRKQPKLFKLISSKAQRLFRKFLEPRVDKRPVTLSDVHRFLDDRWLAKNSSEKNNGLSTEDDGLCPSMYSYHSSPEEKNKLLHSLTQYGIETTVDRGAKKDRIRAWIECSVIEEEDEAAEEETDSEDEERIGIVDNETGPVGERMNRGPIEDKRQQVVKDSARFEKQKRRERRYSAISRRSSNAVYTPPIDPRIPLEKQRFSQSEMNLNRNYVFPSEDYVNQDAITKDDSTISYEERRLEAEVNGNHKEATPPKQNGQAGSTSSLKQEEQPNMYQQNNSTTSLKQNGTTYLKQNGHQDQQMVQSTSQKSVSYHDQQSVSYLKQNQDQSNTVLKQNLQYQDQPNTYLKQSQDQQNTYLKQNQDQQNTTYLKQNLQYQDQQQLKQNLQYQSQQGATFLKQSQDQQNISNLKQNLQYQDQPNTHLKQNLQYQDQTATTYSKQNLQQQDQSTTTYSKQNLQNGHQDQHQPSTSSAYLKQNGHHEQPIPSTSSSSKQSGNNNHNHQEASTSYQPPSKPQQQQQPLPVTADLVENRRVSSSSSSKYRNLKKKPMKERFEAYGSFEEKSNGSSSTGRSTGK